MRAAEEVDEKRMRERKKESEKRNLEKAIGIKGGQVKLGYRELKET